MDKIIEKISFAVLIIYSNVNYLCKQV